MTEQNDDKYAQTRSEIRVVKAPRGVDQTDEEELRAALAQEENTEDEEYEYVPILEATNGPVAKVLGILREYSIVFVLIIVAALCFGLSVLGTQASSIFIALAFGFIAILGAYILYEAWQDKKRAEERYRHAKAVIEPVKQKIKEEAEDK